MRLAYGFGVSYSETLAGRKISTLETRRETAAKKFVAKILEQGGRFSEKWFKERPEVENDIRRRRKFVEKRAKTERYKKSPLLYLQKLANDIITE